MTIPATDPFEIGPIRPPSEAGSYLLRLTRNCPWNRCRFCRTYKRHKFSLRPVEEIEAQIDEMAAIRDRIADAVEAEGPRAAMARGLVTSEGAWMVANALAHGGRTAFLQDADSLVMKPDLVRRVLGRFRDKFPEVERITTYARSRTAARLSVEDLCSFRKLGLTRIHVGMESGHDPLLELIKKGATAELHIRGGQRIKEAGLELSEYIIPGLGGREMSDDHAFDSARVLNAIDPDFIRLRSITLGPKVELWPVFHGPDAVLTRADDAEIVVEIRQFIEALDGISSRLVSDHIMNLLGDLEGRLPEAKDTLLATCDRFLDLGEDEQRLYQVARRAGLVNGLDDLAHPDIRRRADTLLSEVVAAHGPDGVEEGCRQMMMRMV